MIANIVLDFPLYNEIEYLRGEVSNTMYLTGYRVGLQTQVHRAPLLYTMRDACILSESYPSMCRAIYCLILINFHIYLLSHTKCSNIFASKLQTLFGRLIIGKQGAENIK